MKLKIDEYEVYGQEIIGVFSDEICIFELDKSELSFEQIIILEKMVSAFNIQNAMEKEQLDRVNRQRRIDGLPELTLQEYRKALKNFGKKEDNQ